MAHLPLEIFFYAVHPDRLFGESSESLKHRLQNLALTCRAAAQIARPALHATKALSVTNQHDVLDELRGMERCAGAAMLVRRLVVTGHHIIHDEPDKCELSKDVVETILKLMTNLEHVHMAYTHTPKVMTTPDDEEDDEETVYWGADEEAEYNIEVVVEKARHLARAAPKVLILEQIVFEDETALNGLLSIFCDTSTITLSRAHMNIPRSTNFLSAFHSTTKSLTLADISFSSSLYTPSLPSTPGPPTRMRPLSLTLVQSGNWSPATDLACLWAKIPPEVLPAITLLEIGIALDVQVARRDIANTLLTIPVIALRSPNLHSLKIIVNAATFPIPEEAPMTTVDQWQMLANDLAKSPLPTPVMISLTHQSAPRAPDNLLPQIMEAFEKSGSQAPRVDYRADGDEYFTPPVDIYMYKAL